MRKILGHSTRHPYSVQPACTLCAHLTFRRNPPKMFVSCGALKKKRKTSPPFLSAFVVRQSFPPQQQEVLAGGVSRRGDH